MPTSLNNGGQITGYYASGNQVVGFIRIPKQMISEYNQGSEPQIPSLR